MQNTFYPNFNIKSLSDNNIGMFSKCCFLNSAINACWTIKYKYLYTRRSLKTNISWSIPLAVFVRFWLLWTISLAGRFLLSVTISTLSSSSSLSITKRDEFSRFVDNGLLLRDDLGDDVWISVVLVFVGFLAGFCFCELLFGVLS